MQRVGGTINDKYIDDTPIDARVPAVILLRARHRLIVRCKTRGSRTGATRKAVKPPPSRKIVPENESVVESGTRAVSRQP